MCNFFVEQPESAICTAALATEFAGSNDPILVNIREAYANYIDPFEKFLSTNPAITDPRASAIAFLGAMEGIGVQALLYEWKYSPDKLSISLVELISLVFCEKSLPVSQTAFRTVEPDPITPK
jgi:hypothetical protein